MGDGFNELGERIEIRGLDQKRICPEIVSAIDVGGLAGGSEQDDGQPPQAGLLAYPREDFETRYARKLHVQQHANRRTASDHAILERGDGFVTIANDVQSRGNSCAIERKIHEHDVVGIIFDMKDFIFH
jgi:hypothetical protein